MHKSENEKIDFILDEHQQIYRRHNRIDNILAYCACIAWIPCIIAAFGVDGIYLKILFAVLACSGAVCFFYFLLHSPAGITHGPQPSEPGSAYASD